MAIHAPAYSKSTALYAVVNRADGTTEDLGLIAYHHKNPVINRIVNSYISLKDKLRHDRTRSE